MNFEFKNNESENDYQNIPQALRIVCDYFISLSNKLGVIPVITRVKEPVQGESGVHQANRAVDFRDEMGVGGPRLYDDLQVHTLVEEMNKRFPRKDGKDVCIYHAFVNHMNPMAGRAPFHFHIQIPYDWAIDYQMMPKSV